MTNKYHILLRKASMIELKLDMSDVEDIVIDALGRDLNFSMEDKIRLYSDEENHSVAFEILSDKLSESQLDNLYPYHLEGDFINMDLAMHSYFKGLGVDPNSVFVSALDNDDEMHSPCEIVIIK